MRNGLEQDREATTKERDRKKYCWWRQRKLHQRQRRKAIEKERSNQKTRIERIECVRGDPVIQDNNKAQDDRAVHTSTIVTDKRTAALHKCC